MLDETGISDDFRKAVESGINEDMLSELAFEIKDFISDACEHFEETPTEDHVRYVVQKLSQILHRIVLAEVEGE